jgi:hypothetical protein
VFLLLVKDSLLPVHRVCCRVDVQFDRNLLPLMAYMAAVHAITPDASLFFKEEGNSFFLSSNQLIEISVWPTSFFPVRFFFLLFFLTLLTG